MQSLVVHAVHEGDEILNMDSADGLPERVEHCLSLVVLAVHEAAGKGDDILVHCRHGIHRSGSFVVLVLALFILLHEIYNGISPHSELYDVLNQAWLFWAQRRDLASRSDHRHDYEAESWKALDEYFGFLQESDAGGLAILPSRGIQRGCGSLRRTKEIINEVSSLMSQQSMKSEPSEQTAGGASSSARPRSRSPPPAVRAVRPRVVLRPSSSSSSKRMAKAMPQRRTASAVPAVPDVPDVPAAGDEEEVEVRPLMPQPPPSPPPQPQQD